MAERSNSRLGAAHLDELAIVIITTPPGADAILRPELDEDSRARLRSRLKLIGRHDWPSNLREDPALRRGYTLRQCFRLMTALVLLDAHIPPSIAIQITRANELQFLRTITTHLTHPPTLSENDPIAVLMLGQFWEWLDQPAWSSAEPYRVRIMARAALSNLWSNDLGLAIAGQRLTIEIGGVARSMWEWIRARDLLPASALNDLVEELALHGSAPCYQASEGISKRR